MPLIIIQQKKPPYIYLRRFFFNVDLDYSIIIFLTKEELSAKLI